MFSGEGTVGIWTSKSTLCTVIVVCVYHAGKIFFISAKTRPEQMMLRGENKCQKLILRINLPAININIRP